MKRLILAASLLVLAACGQSTTATTEATTTIAEQTVPAGTSPCVAGEAVQGQPITVSCANNVTFTAGYTESGCVIVNAGGQTYHLPGVIAASGSRFYDGTVEYWEHQGDAMLNGAAGGPYNECKLPPAQ